MPGKSGLESLASCSAVLFLWDCFTFLCPADARNVKFATSDTGVYKKRSKEEKRGKRSPFINRVHF